MQAFQLSELVARQDGDQVEYAEFLRVPQLSMGLYKLPAGSRDPQQPHAEDEVYYVVSGQATLRVEDEEQPVQAGSLVYVPARARHTFHDIIDDLVALVFFAPAESG